MWVNVAKLKGAVVEKNTTLEALAANIGVDRSTIYRKIQNGGLTYTIGEIHKIVEALQLTQEEVLAIFFKE